MLPNIKEIIKKHWHILTINRSIKKNIQQNPTIELQ